MAWLDESNLRYPQWRFSLFLSEGYLYRGDYAAARSLAEGVLKQSRDMGYLHFEGVARWLIGECLAPEVAASAEPYVENAMAILERVGARNDLARAMVTRAALRQAVGDLAIAREFIEHAGAIFHELGTLDEQARVEAARSALNRGAAISLLASRS